MVPTYQCVRYTAAKARLKRERDAKKKTTNGDDQGNAPLEDDESSPRGGPDSHPVMQVDQKDQIQHVAGSAEACRKIIATIDLHGKAAGQEFQAVHVAAIRTLISNMVSCEDEDGEYGDREHMVAVDLYCQDPASMVQQASPLPKQRWADITDETSTDDDTSEASGYATDDATPKAPDDPAPNPTPVEMIHHRANCRCEDCMKMHQTLVH